ncbi:hypothetical protein NEOLEDRAFT_744437 [Neolentinus lepideus HHB14362 ss-1]|uniref:Chromo domain-containing protein n=1 Tax=Neolentinus lepideus HHB14362 ss-1 TaxID=1314782 RepID=A0A165PXD9_9AGAM|nr:hypothetical protein NEOLEDRAFT_744437 [Neolentinus lepideus HHB14362 ss-1]
MPPSRRVLNRRPTHSKTSAGGQTKVRTVNIEGRTLRVSPVFDTLFLWMAERDAIRRKRVAGEPAPWTDDPIFSKYRFTNVFRVFDRTTQYILKNVINRGSTDLNECAFRVMLFRTFNRISTWELLESSIGALTWKAFDFDTYKEVLGEAVRDGQALYGYAYIIPAPSLGMSRNYENHLLLLQRMMEDHLPEKLKEVKHIEDAHRIMISYPSMGDFTGFQLLLDLNMIPHYSFSEDEWAICGPGSAAGLRKIFGDDVKGIETAAMVYLRDTQNEHWERLDISEPPSMHPGKIGVSLVDLEHSLCECEKYSRVKHPSIKGKRTSIKATFCAKPEALTVDLPARWASRLSVNAHDAWMNVDESDPEYEVSHIVKESNADDGTIEYLVRWTGYGPEDDLWLEEDQLRGAAEVLDAWWKKCNGAKRGSKHRARKLR